MLLGIDHLVIAVSDPDEAVALLQDRLGLAPGGGGRHEGSAPSTAWSGWATAISS